MNYLEGLDTFSFCYIHKNRVKGLMWGFRVPSLILRIKFSAVTRHVNLDIEKCLLVLLSFILVRLMFCCCFYDLWNAATWHNPSPLSGNSCLGTWNLQILHSAYFLCHRNANKQFLFCKLQFTFKINLTKIKQHSLVTQ